MSRQHLDPELLQELGSRLSAQHVPAMGVAQAGLSDDELDEMSSEAGLSLPDEARVWWRWRNGTPEQVGAPVQREIGPGFWWMRLEDALSRRASIYQSFLAEFDGDEVQVRQAWTPSWLPFVWCEGPYVLDTEVPVGMPSPIWIYKFYEPPTAPVLPSLRELVLLWIEALDRGAWRYDPVAQRWRLDHDLLSRWSSENRAVHGGAV